MNARRVAIQVLPAITSVLLIAATLTAYAWRVAFDSGQFSRRATSALQDPTVREAIANRVTDELVRRHPDLLAARPALESAVSGVVGGDAFGSLFRSGVGDVHRAVLRGDEDTVTLTVRDVGVLAAEALRVLRPDLATELEAREGAALLDYAFDTDLVRFANDVRLLAYVLALLAAAAAAALVLLAEDRRSAVARLGFTVLVSGAVIVVAQAVAGVLVLERFQDTDARAAAAAVWDAYLGDLRTTGWLIAGAGAVLAAAARSLIRPVAVEEPLRRVWRAVVSEPGSVRWRAVRGIVLIGFGVLVIALPEAVLQLALTLAGVYALYKGLEAILRLVNGPVAERPPRRIAVAAVSVVLLAGAAAAYFAGGGVDEPAPAIAAGCGKLCDRPLDELTLPATHNSMSVPLPGWYASLQGHPIDRQLADGIRGLLLDTHYAERLDNGRIRTYFESPQAMRAQIAEDGVSEESAAAALRLRARLGYRGDGERGMYLCHTFCELGATPLADVLDDIHDFLVTHPAAVLVIVNQDYVTPKDFVAALDAAGLSRYALEPPPREADWPTLEQVIERDRRLLVLAENQAGAAPWYQLAYERLTQETPFTFKRTGELTDPATLDASCRPNRGPAGAPLLLVNHWINTDPAPRPSNAAIVNAYEPLLRRARACERVRERRVNLLAVDFYERGDVFAVVDALNENTPR